MIRYSGWKDVDYWAVFDENEKQRDDLPGRTLHLVPFARKNHRTVSHVILERFEIPDVLTWENSPFPLI